MIKTYCLNKANAAKYEDFLKAQENSFLYISIKYKQMLEALLKTRPHYLVAEMDGRIIGAFPIMFAESDNLGIVANSLPFYGSNGGIIIDSRLSEKDRFSCWLDLLKTGEELIKEQECVSSTFITSPFDPNPGWYREHAVSNFYDERIGQITLLPDCDNNVEERLMTLFHQKTRNMVRKAIKHDIKITTGNSSDDFAFLEETHIANMATIGGLAKKRDFFDSVTAFFEAGEYFIHTAWYNGQRIAALLLFYFNRTVEYFTPVISQEFRQLQPMSLLIFRAMIGAVQKNFKYWNWGGTWNSQEGVYRFKSRWGAKDFPYSYFINVRDDSLKQVSKEMLLKEFPHFYVLPFSALG
jgi:hypothetical protein